MSSEQPFQQLFETFGKLPPIISPEVNESARAKMKDWLSAPLGKPGHFILLKSFRAGCGKTHLLSQVQHELRKTHEFISVCPVGSSRIDAFTLLHDTLCYLAKGEPSNSGLTKIDLISRRLFSEALQPLVHSGEVPCQDQQGALDALRMNPVGTLDFHEPEAVTANWARENFELLGPRLAGELSQANGLPLREVSFWVDALFRFAATPVDNPGRSHALEITVFDDLTSESAIYQRLTTLLGLLNSLSRVVLIFDEVEGFSFDESAGLKLASFLGSIRRDVGGVDVVLSINQDIWENAFLPRLSGGLADRLSEVVVELELLTHEAMKSILDLRSPGSSEALLGQMGDAATIPNYARGLLKQAGELWLQNGGGTIVREEASPKNQETGPGIALGQVGADSLQVPESSTVEPPFVEKPSAEVPVAETLVGSEIEESPELSVDPFVVDAGEGPELEVSAFDDSSLEAEQEPESVLKTPEAVDVLDGDEEAPFFENTNEEVEFSPNESLERDETELSTGFPPNSVEDPFQGAPEISVEAFENPVAAQMEADAAVEEVSDSGLEENPPTKTDLPQEWERTIVDTSSSIPTVEDVPDESLVAVRKNVSLTTARVEDLLQQFRDRYRKE